MMFNIKLYSISSSFTKAMFSRDLMRPVLHTVKQYHCLAPKPAVFSRDLMRPVLHTAKQYHCHAHKPAVFSRGLIRPVLNTVRQYHCLTAKPRLAFTRLPLHKYLTTNSNVGLIGSLKKRVKSLDSVDINVFLLIAVSVGIGFFFVTYFVFNQYKKVRLHMRGLIPLHVPSWKKHNMVRYKDTVLPQFAADQLEEIEKFKVRPDDVWVVSFPRSGTTWLQEIVYLLQSNFNWKAAKSTKLDDRFPYLEFMHPGVKVVEMMASPRLIKSHLPLSLLPPDIEEKKPKIIYIARNPKDVVVSFFYFVRKLKPVSNFDGKFEAFYDFFLQDKVMYAPWWKHVLEFWDRREDKNILFITYEDLKLDTPGTVRKVAKFLGKEINDAQLDELMDHCSFRKMRNNRMVNHSWFVPLGVALATESDFVRKGCIGDWTNHITREMNPRIDRMIVSKLRGSGLKFTYQANYKTLQEAAKTSTKDVIQTK